MLMVHLIWVAWVIKGNFSAGSPEPAANIVPFRPGGTGLFFVDRRITIAPEGTVTYISGKNMCECYEPPSTFLPYLLIFPGKIFILAGEYVPKRNIRVDAINLNEFKKP